MHTPRIRPDSRKPSKVRQIFQEQNTYSAVLNKRARFNKRAGRKFHEISISEQALISEQGGNSMDFNDRAGYNKQAGRNFYKANISKQASIIELGDLICKIILPK